MFVTFKEMKRRFNQRIFDVVARQLVAWARLLNISYNEINCLVYYFIIPFTWLILIDVLCGFHFLKIAFFIFCLGFYLGCTDFKIYADRLFKKSVHFLNYFNRFGSNYVAASVWICVLLPILIYGILIYLIFFR